MSVLFYVFYIFWVICVYSFVFLGYIVLNDGVEFKRKEEIDLLYINLKFYCFYEIFRLNMSILKIIVYFWFIWS